MLTWKMRSQGSKALLSENCFEKCPGLSLWLWFDALLPSQSPHELPVMLFFWRNPVLSVLVVLVQTALPWPCCAAVLAILFLITLLGLIYKFSKKEEENTWSSAGWFVWLPGFGLLLCLWVLDFSMLCLILNSNPIVEEKILIFHTEWHYLRSSKHSCWFPSPQTWWFKNLLE